MTYVRICCRGGQKRSLDADFYPRLVRPAEPASKLGTANRASVAGARAGAEEEEEGEQTVPVQESEVPQTRAPTPKHGFFGSGQLPHAIFGPGPPIRLADQQLPTEEEAAQIERQQVLFRFPSAALRPLE